MEEAGVDDVAQLLERVRCRTDLVEHLPLEPADPVLHRLEEQLLLVAEVVVDRALGDAGVACDPVDRGALVAEAREAIDGRSHEVLTRRLRPLSTAIRPPGRHTERSVSSVTRPVNQVRIEDWIIRLLTEPPAPRRLRGLLLGTGAFNSALATFAATDSGV